MTSTLNEIIDAMKSTRSGGLNFFNQTVGLPSYTFIGNKLRPKKISEGNVISSI